MIGRWRTLDDPLDFRDAILGCQRRGQYLTAEEKAVIDELASMKWNAATINNISGDRIAFVQDLHRRVVRQHLEAQR